MRLNIRYLLLLALAVAAISLPVKHAKAAQVFDNKWAVYLTVDAGLNTTITAQELTWECGEKLRAETIATRFGLVAEKRLSNRATLTVGYTHDSQPGCGDLPFGFGNNKSENVLDHFGIGIKWRLF